MVFVIICNIMWLLGNRMDGCRESITIAILRLLFSSSGGELSTLLRISCSYELFARASRATYQHSDM